MQRRHEPAGRVDRGDRVAVERRPLALQRAPQEPQDGDRGVEVDDERRVVEEVRVPVAGVQDAQRAIDDLRLVDADRVRDAGVRYHSARGATARITTRMASQRARARRRISQTCRCLRRIPSCCTMIRVMGHAFTIGVEEEFQIVDPGHLGAAIARLRAAGVERPVARRSDQARAAPVDRRGRHEDLRQRRRARATRSAASAASSSQSAERVGLRIAAAGTHPFSKLEGPGHLPRRALREHRRRAAAAGAVAADLRPAHPRRRARSRRARSSCSTRRATSCRTCSRSRPARRSGRDATPA